MLRIIVLGTPYLLWNEKPLTIKRRIPRAILFFLAAEGKPISRNSLQTLFWPEETEDVARARFRDNLSKLRSALPDPDLVQTIDETLILAPEKVRVDLIEFNGLVKQMGKLPWKLSPTIPLSTALYNALVSAARLWQGPGLLSGLYWPSSSALEDWHRAIEFEAQQTLQRVLARLIDHEAAIGDLDQVINWVYIALQFDKLDENLNFLLLKTLISLDRRTEARKHFQEIETLFQLELGSELPEAIQMLQEQVFEQGSLTQAKQPLTWPVHSSITIPYVGQENVLEQLNRVYKANSGVIIFGEAGAGKTRLVQEFYQNLNTKPRLLMAEGNAAESNLPYYLWINLVRRSIAIEEWQRLSPAWAAPLTLILPELADVHHELQTQVVFELDHPRTVLLEAIHQLFSLLAKDGPLLLFIDDAHWADESSVAILAYLLQQSFFDDGHCFLVMTSRIEEKNPWLDKLLLNISSQRLHQIGVANLGSEEVADLVQYVLEKAPSQDFVERLTKDTGGNPLFVLETLQAIFNAEQNQPTEETVRFPLAPSVHQLIQARVQKLSAQAKKLLYPATLLGVEFDLALIKNVTRTTDVEALQVLEELETSRFIQCSQGDGRIEYSFIHAKIRDSVLLDLSPARKRLYHAKIASALKQRYEKRLDSQSAQIAHHYQESGNLPSAFDFWVQAGHYAYRLFSIQEATAAFSSAERIIPREPDLTEDQLYQLYSGWSDMAFENDDPETLFRINKTALFFGEERNSDLLIGTAYDGLSDACFAANKFQQGLEYTKKGLPYLERSGNTFELMEILTHRGAFEYMLGEFEPSREWFIRALDLAPQTTDQNLLRTRGHAKGQMALIFTLTGRPKTGAEYAERSLQDYIRANRSYGQAYAYSMIGLANYVLTDFASGQQACEQGIKIAQRSENWRMLGYLHCYASMNELELGNLSAAWQSAMRALELGKLHRHDEIVGLGNRVVGDIYFHLGAYEQAANYYQQGLAAAGEHFIALENLYRLGTVLAFANDPTGEQYIRQAIEKTEDVGLLCIAAFAHFMLMSAFIASQQYDLFEQQSALIDKLDISPSYIIATAPLPYLKAEALFAQGDLDTCLHLVEKNLTEMAAYPLIWYQMRTLGLKVRVFRQLQKDATEIINQIQLLLDQIEKTIGAAPIQDEWQQFILQYKNI